MLQNTTKSGQPFLLLETKLQSGFGIIRGNYGANKEIRKN